MLFTETTNSLLKPPFRRVGGKVRTSYIDRLKARITDFLFAITELLSLALTVETL